MNHREGTEWRIRTAAVRALAKHGYANLSIKRIGEELGQSSSLLYHYFDDKDDLLLSTLDLIGEEFVEQQDHDEPSDPKADLADLIDAFFDPLSVAENSSTNEGEIEFKVVLVHVYAELWAQATRDERYRTKITELENQFVDEITQSLKRGIEENQFREVPPKKTAEHMFALFLHGLHTKTAVDRDEAAEMTRTSLYRLAERELSVDLRNFR